MRYLGVILAFDTILWNCKDSAMKCDCLSTRLLFGFYCDMFDHITQIEISSSYNWELLLRDSQESEMRRGVWLGW